jgi:putative YphP/YqiW family bacilliredoxin
MYPEIMIVPMREELVRAGIQETRTVEEVERALDQPGTTMVVVNSICGCAAGKMRPGVRMALKHPTQPDRKITVFAGQDREATEKVRSRLEGNPPSSPAIAIFQDGKLAFLMQRSVIESVAAPQIAQYLTQAFDDICTKTNA